MAFPPKMLFSFIIPVSTKNIRFMHSVDNRVNMFQVSHIGLKWKAISPTLMYTGFSYLLLDLCFRNINFLVNSLLNIPECVNVGLVNLAGVKEGRLGPNQLRLDCTARHSLVNVIGRHIKCLCHIKKIHTSAMVAN